jgi:hypothetical protein
MLLRQWLCLVPLTSALTTAAIGCSGTSVDVSKPDGGNSDSGGDGGSCVERNAAPREFCSLSRAKPQVPLTLSVRQDCAGPVATGERCVVTVAGTVITVRMLQTVCPRGDNAPLVCRVAEVDCALPPLAAGAYNVIVDPLGGVSADAAPADPAEAKPAPMPTPTGTLVVVAGGEQTACKLAPLGSQPPTIKTSDYPGTCKVDADCTPVDTAVCNPCCVDAAIATVDLEKYQRDIANKAATCTRGQQGPVCSCVAGRTICGADNKCALTRL